MNDLSQFFSLNKLPYNNGEIIPKDWVKKKIGLGFVPDEKDETNPNMYMDEIFEAGGEEPTPVGPKDNEIWYWGEYYDLAKFISVVGQQQGIPYAGPAILSNKQVGDKYVITFDGPVTKLGLEIAGEGVGKSYPIFGNIPGLSCNTTHIQIPESVTDMLTYCFLYNKTLQDFIIPNSVTHVDTLAFYTGDYLSSYVYPIKLIISNGIVYETNNNTNIDIVLANGNEVRLVLWDRITENVSVNVVDSEGVYHEVTLDPNTDYNIQGYGGYYSQSTYNSDMGERAEDFLVDHNYPDEGDTIYETIEDEAEPEPATEVEVTIQYEDGTSETITLNPNETFADQGCGGYYWQNWYNSNEGESADNFLVDDTYPTAGETIYSYCNDITIDITIYMENAEFESVKLRRDMSFFSQGYEGYYISDTYNSSEGETPEMYSADYRLPGEDISPDPDIPDPLTSIYNYCNDIAEPDEPEPEP